MNIFLEIFGYVGTALVLLSMMMPSVVKLRLFNTVGSFISMIYAFLSGAWPGMRNQKAQVHKVPALR